MRSNEEPGPLPGATLDRLVRAASRSRADATFADLLLDAVAVIVERPRVDAPLPATEQQQWSAVGARFDVDGALENDRRVIEAHAALLERSIVGDAAMARALGVDRSRISQRLSEHSLYAFSAGDERCFPRWQLIDGKPLRGLRPVLAAMDPALHPLLVDHWFTAPHVDLEVQGAAVDPVTWLATGGSPEVVAGLVPSR